MLTVIKTLLQRLIDDIDAGNSHIDEEDASNIIVAIQKYSHLEQYYTKYQACKYLHNISRATFDNLVRDGKIPQGIKLYAGDNNLFWKVTDLKAYRERNQKNKNFASVAKLLSWKSMS